MPIDPVLIVGAGGHGKVVLDALLCRGTEASRVLVFDEDEDRAGTELLGFPVLHLKCANALRGSFHVAIGAAGARRRVAIDLEASGLRPMAIHHPLSAVSVTARVGNGCFIAAHAVVGPDSAIGEGVIINHGAVVDHDCRIGEFAHIAPNVTLGGGVRIGASTLIGSAATIFPGRSIGEGATIGAGAVVLNDVASGETWVGVPARVKR